MIIIYEPQCTGFEHVEFNAALITLFTHAFPNEKILFLAEEEHLRQVSKKIEAQLVKGAEFSAIILPPRRFSSLRKLPGELRLCRQVFELAARNQANKVVFSSITSPSLIAMKSLIRIFPEIKCIVIPHHILGTLVERPSLRRPLEVPFWFRLWFPWGNTDKMKYLVLGSSIKEQLNLLFPNLKKSIWSIDLPYFYKEPDGFWRSDVKKIRFGSFGVGHRGKGTDLFFKMAEEIQAEETKYKPEFILIGHIVDKTIRYSPDFVSVPSPDAPLNRKDFDLFARDIDYAVFVHKPITYRFVASGALFDAFSYLKPVIALRNPFFEYYFNTMGDIGYLCDSYDEMKKVILDLLESKPTERYVCQRGNILQGREWLTLSKLSENITGVWD